MNFMRTVGVFVVCLTCTSLAHSTLLFTNVLDTPLEHEYEFSGTGLSELEQALVGPTSVNGGWIATSSIANWSAGDQSGWSLTVSRQHSDSRFLPDPGPMLTISFLFGAGGYGTSTAEGHGLAPDQDVLELTFFHARDAQGNIGDFSGTLKAIHDGPWVLGPEPVPEPSTLALVGIAIAGIGFARRRKQ